MRKQRGLGVIAAIVVLLLLALMSAAMLTISTGQQLSSALDYNSSRGEQVARAGIEWGLFRATSPATPMDPWKACNNAVATVDLRAQTTFSVTVRCNSQLFNEGETAPGAPRRLRVYEITAVSCPSAVCPDNAAAAQSFYVERSQRTIAVSQ